MQATCSAALRTDKIIAMALTAQKRPNRITVPRQVRAIQARAKIRTAPQAMRSKMMMPLQATIRHRCYNNHSHKMPLRQRVTALPRRSQTRQAPTAQRQKVPQTLPKARLRIQQGQPTLQRPHKQQLKPRQIRQAVQQTPALTETLTEPLTTRQGHLIARP